MSLVIISYELSEISYEKSAVSDEMSAAQSSSLMAHSQFPIKIINQSCISLKAVLLHLVQ